MPKKSASKKTPRRMLGLVTPLLMTRSTSVHANFLDFADLLEPLVEIHHTHRLKGEADQQE